MSVKSNPRFALRASPPAVKANRLMLALVHLQDAEAELQDLYFSGATVVRSDLQTARTILLAAALAEPETGQGGGL